MGRLKMLALMTLAFGAAAHAADVHVGINIGVPAPAPPPIAIEAPPPLVVVPNSPVYYAPSLPYNFFYYDGLYYVFHEGSWFSSVSAHGPWGFVPRVPRPVLAVPVGYYRVPPGHWKKHGPPPWAGHGHEHERWHEHDHGHGKHHDDD
jgi:hypothetical protein